MHNLLHDMIYSHGVFHDPSNCHKFKFLQATCKHINDAGLYTFTIMTFYRLH